MNKELTIVAALSIYIATVCVALLGGLKLGAIAGWLARGMRGDVSGFVWLGMIVLIPILPAIPAQLFWGRSSKSDSAVNKAITTVVIFSFYVSTHMFLVAVWLGLAVFTVSTTAPARPSAWLMLIKVTPAFALIPTFLLWRYFSKNWLERL
jgi:hypothetical protein